MAEIELDLNSTALIIADFYAEAMNTVPHALERGVVEKAQALQETARGVGIMLLYTATVFRDGYPEISPRNKTFSERKSSGQPAVSDPIAIIHPQVAPRPGEPVIGKHRVNPFYQTDLEMILRANGVETLALFGYATSGVILSMVRYGADADFRLVVVEDCCVDREAEVHDFLINRIFPRQTTIASSTEVIRAISKGLPHAPG